MPLTYAVMLTPKRTWSVLEDGTALVSFADRAEAVEMGQLLALAAKAAGRKATMVVEVEGGSQHPQDVERALLRGDAAFRRVRRRDETRSRGVSLVALG